MPDRTAVKLGPDGLQAYRYEGLKPAGTDRQMTVYASPTSEGVATVACLAPPADAAAFKGATARAIANTLQVSEGKPFPVGPDPAFAETLGATFGTLQNQVAKGRKALKPTGRSSAARRRPPATSRPRTPAAAAQLDGAEVSPADARIHAALAGG